jgi:hypothetical protein
MAETCTFDYCPYYSDCPWLRVVDDCQVTKLPPSLDFKGIDSENVSFEKISEDDFEVKYVITKLTDSDRIRLLLFSPEGKAIKYTVNDTNPLTHETAIDATDTVSIDTEDHMIIRAITIESDGTVSKMVQYQYNVEVDIVLHPEKDRYSYGDVVTATLNSTYTNNIQTYNMYRWSNEQAEWRFDSSDDDDYQDVPRPEFILNKIGRFKIRVWYKDEHFKSTYKDKYIEIYPRMSIRYKGVKGNIEDEKSRLVINSSGGSLI